MGKTHWDDAMFANMCGPPARQIKSLCISVLALMECPRRVMT